MAAASRNLRYDKRQAVNGSLAYDLDWAVRERELSHAGEAPARQEPAAEQPKVRRLSKTQVRQRQSVSLLSVLGVAAVVGMAVLLLLSYIRLNEISTQVVELKSQLSQLETENVTLTTQHERMFDLETVREAAEAAGMSKPSSSQIYYVDLAGSDSAEVYSQEEPGLATKLLTSLNRSFYTVVEYFD